MSSRGERNSGSFFEIEVPAEKNLLPRSGQCDQFPIQGTGDFFQCRKGEICRLAFVTANRAARRPDFLGKRFLGETGAFASLGRISKQIHLMSINHACPLWWCSPRHHFGKAR